jgi:hypothetical protein
MGASGAGVTSLGRALADALAFPHHDADDYFWQPTIPPCQKQRDCQPAAADTGFLLQRKTSCLFKKLRLIAMDEVERHGQRYPDEIADVGRPNIRRQETKHWQTARARCSSFLHGADQAFSGRFVLERSDLLRPIPDTSPRFPPFAGGYWCHVFSRF